MQHAATGRAVDRGLLEQPPAVEHRLGIDQRGVLARRTDREPKHRGLAAEPAEHGATGDLGSAAEADELGLPLLAARHAEAFHHPAEAVVAVAIAVAVLDHEAAPAAALGA